MVDEGAWSELPTGGHVLRLRISSPGASEHVLVFRYISQVILTSYTHRRH